MTFKTGDPKPPTSGRKRGTPNRQTAALKDAILRATELVGRELDPECPDGVVAYLQHIARTDPRTMAGLLGRVLPLQVKTDGPELRQIEIVHRTVPFEPPAKSRRPAKVIDAKPVEPRAALLPKPDAFWRDAEGQ